MTDPRSNWRRPARFALILAAIAALIWGTFVIGQIVSGKEEMKNSTRAGQQRPAPNDEPARQPPSQP